MKLFKCILEQYYTSEILIGFTQVEAIANGIIAQSPVCNMLVFGAGHDSLLWHELTKATGGHTVFLETSDEWIQKLLLINPFLDIRKYDLEGVTVKNSLSCALHPRPCPSVLKEYKWDIILIDGPEGWGSNCPGRAYPIIWSSEIRQPYTYIYVDDYNIFMLMIIIDILKKFILINF